MDDLISRQKTLDHLRKRLIQTANNNVGFVCDAGSTFEDASERVKTWLDEVPSIDAVKHGVWEIYVISMFDGEGCRCSECGFEGVPYWDFCPNCGARMDGEENG